MKSSFFFSKPVLCYRLRGSRVIRGSQVTIYALSVQKECIWDRVLNSPCLQGKDGHVLKDLLGGFIYIKDHVSHSGWKSGAKSFVTTSKCYLHAAFSTVYAWFAVKGSSERKMYKRSTPSSHRDSTSPVVVLGPVCTSWGYWLIF